MGVPLAELHRKESEAGEEEGEEEEGGMRNVVVMEVADGCRRWSVAGKKPAGGAMARDRMGEMRDRMRNKSSVPSVGKGDCLHSLRDALGWRCGVLEASGTGDRAATVTGPFSLGAESRVRLFKTPH